MLVEAVKVLDGLVKFSVDNLLDACLDCRALDFKAFGELLHGLDKAPGYVILDIREQLLLLGMDRVDALLVSRDWLGLVRLWHLLVLFFIEEPLACGRRQVPDLLAGDILDIVAVYAAHVLLPGFVELVLSLGPREIFEYLTLSPHICGSLDLDGSFELLPHFPAVDEIFLELLA